ncbi:glycosyltransferase family 2 protein [Lysinibacillus cavernae]|uniref:glycosyltransferase family 2 protein n=1 Tax=Lysinibacillus cavernae TaxID=2666135 RepID=UPI0012D9A880|nr:glycosyltransferase family 2 protein [Lysinibacillus cavernae]
MLQWQQKSERNIKTYLVLFLFTVMLAGITYLNVGFKGGVSKTFGLYGSIMIVYLIGKMTLSFYYKPYVNEPPDVKVSVFIPSYNEKPEAVLGTVQSILDQDYPVHEIFFIDDGSVDDSGYRAVLDFKEKWERERDSTKSLHYPKLIVHQLSKNQGKRHAQIWAFEQATGDIFFTVDSDGYVYPDALKELLRPFANPEVMAVTGHINARNKNHNLFTKLLDMRYDNAFRVERAAQSTTGNILVCSGPISCYRREIVMDNIEHYGSQLFLGKAVQSGDDRCLTNYAILKGKTVYQSGARCDTDVPDNLKQFLKQQIRWNKSFFRESVIAFKIGFHKPITLIWVTFEMLLWILFGFVIILAIIYQVESFGLVMFFYYLLSLSLSAYARNIHYVVKRPLIFILAPLYGLIHLVLLFPLRMFALLTIKEAKWGTR